MIEKMYGPEIFYEDAANSMISEAYGKAYEECGLEIVSAGHRCCSAGKREKHSSLQRK